MSYQYKKQMVKEYLQTLKTKITLTNLLLEMKKKYNITFSRSYTFNVLKTIEKEYELKLSYEKTERGKLELIITPKHKGIF